MQMSDLNRVVIVSCILTLHNEGMIAHKTFASIRRAINYAEKFDIICELVIVLDDPSIETIEYVEQSKLFPVNTSIYRTDFKDPGLARNYGIKKSCGNYIAILDGDDLYSENWLYEAYKLNLESDLHIIQSELNINFGDNHFVHWQVDQRSSSFQAWNLLVENYWTALCFAKKSIFLEIPYTQTQHKSGFGYEDWHWNCDTVARGYVHVVAPKTAHFIRIKKSGSRNKEAFENSAVIRHSILFDSSELLGIKIVQDENQDNDATPESLEWSDNSDKTMPTDVHVEKNKGGLGDVLEQWIDQCKSKGRAPPTSEQLSLISSWDEDAYLESNEDVKLAIDAGDLKNGLQHWLQYGYAEGRILFPTRIPFAIREEMEALSKYELGVFPAKGLFKEASQHKVQCSDKLGEAYAYMLSLSDNFTHVFLLPWLIRGGADLVALHHINYLAREFSASILVITTENQDSTWLDRLPKSVKVIEFGKKYASLLQDREKQLLLTRILLKLKPQVVHNINSKLGWEIFNLYGGALSQEMKLFVSLFAFEHSQDYGPLGHAHYLGSTYKFLTKIFSDNLSFIELMREMHGFKDNFFKQYRYPQVAHGRFIFNSNMPTRILWAGRFEKSKRLDLLLKISQQLPDIEFDLFGAPTFTPAHEMKSLFEALSKMKNINLKGAYNGFDSIPSNNYLLLLYTTESDGLPNVILEALSSGLPVLAPNIGGVSEVVDKVNGFLIDRYDDVNAFVSFILRISSDLQTLVRERIRGITVIHQKFSPESFISELKSTPEYLPKNYDVSSRK